MSTENAPSVDVLKTQATDAVRKVSDTIHDQANVLRDTAAGVVDARDQVGLVEKILIFLVEAAEIDQRRTPERAIRAE